MSTQIKINSKRGKYAITLIWIIFALEIISLILYTSQFQILNQNLDKNNIPQSILTVANNSIDIVGIVYTIIYIISAIAFLMWFRRAYYNLHLKVKHLSYKESWSLWSWFVPVINLFRPYQIMIELFLHTDILLSKKINNYTPSHASSLIGFWWFLWLISSFFGNYVFRYSANANSSEELVTSAMLSIINSVIGISSALITIKLLKIYTKEEPLFYEINEEKYEALRA